MKQGGKSDIEIGDLANLQYLRGVRQKSDQIWLHQKISASEDKPAKSVVEPGGQEVHIWDPPVTQMLKHFWV